MLTPLFLLLGLVGNGMDPATAPEQKANAPAVAAPSSATPDKDDKKDDKEPEEPPPHWFPVRFFKAYVDEFCKEHREKAKKAQEGEKQDDKKQDDKSDDKKQDKTDETPKRRANPAPFLSPPFPSVEWQGYPNIGVPPVDYSAYPLNKAIQGTSFLGIGDFFKDERIYIYGWATGSMNYSTSRQSNTPDAYAVVPNKPQLDQLVLRFEREPDQVQTDHIDWGFRMTGFYGIDYRYTTAGGYGSEQLLNHNRLYGMDPLEIYGDIYVPRILDGMNIRVGRYISPPDIEAQLAPDNLLASHSILFTYDNYTQTGVLCTVKINDQWMVQAGINAGGDMAPWYKGAQPTGFLGVRWISKDNKDSIYTCYNDINSAKYREFFTNGQESGHDNYNYIVSTWTHRFNDKFFTATEAYYMYEFDAHVGGTPSVGPAKYGMGGGVGPLIPGLSNAYGVLNYTPFAITKKDFITVRNEYWADPQGFRSGFATDYSSHTIGLTHNFNAYLQVRPEVGVYHSYGMPAFDNGNRKNMFLALMDFTLRF
jgi:Putative beta-barrel porin-2, OmpL-like. bbp2